MTLIYKIFRADEYQDFARNGITHGAPIDVTDGYIHFSTDVQVAETAAKHFASEDGLKLLALDAEALSADLKWEPSRGGALFPHLYRQLKAEDVIWVRDLPLVEGQHDFAGLLPS